MITKILLEDLIEFGLSYAAMADTLNCTEDAILRKIHEFGLHEALDLRSLSDLPTADEINLLYIRKYGMTVAEFRALPNLQRSRAVRLLHDLEIQGHNVPKLADLVADSEYFEQLNLPKYQVLNKF